MYKLPMSESTEKSAIDIGNGCDIKYHHKVDKCPGKSTVKNIKCLFYVSYIFDLAIKIL